MPAHFGDLLVREAKLDAEEFNFNIPDGDVLIHSGDWTYQGTIPSVKRFLEWFNSKEDREISPWREFCEELLTTNIITDKHSFRYIDYKYAYTLQTPMQKAKNLDCQEILIFEIFDLIPSTEQIQVLDNLYHLNNSDKVKWADEILINSLGFNAGVTLD